MAKYQILVAQSAGEFLSKLDRKERMRIDKRIKKLGLDPEHFGEFRGDFWLLKVGRGGYRVAYEILRRERTVRILTIEKRSGAYERRFYR